MMHEINVIRGSGDVFPYLLMYLMLKICQGLSALGCRIIRSLSSWIFWWVEGTFTLSSRAFTIMNVCISSTLFPSLFISLFPGQHLTMERLSRMSTTNRNTSSLFLDHLSWPEWEASFSWSLSWGYFVGKCDCSPGHQSGEEWSLGFPIFLLSEREHQYNVCLSVTGSNTTQTHWKDL